MFVHPPGNNERRVTQGVQVGVASRVSRHVEPQQLREGTVMLVVIGHLPPTHITMTTLTLTDTHTSITTHPTMTT